MQFLCIYKHCIHYNAASSHRRTRGFALPGPAVAPSRRCLGALASPAPRLGLALSRGSAAAAVPPSRPLHRRLLDDVVARRRSARDHERPICGWPEKGGRDGSWKSPCTTNRRLSKIDSYPHIKSSWLHRLQHTWLLRKHHDVPDIHLIGAMEFPGALKEIHSALGMGRTWVMG